MLVMDIPDFVRLGKNGTAMRLRETLEWNGDWQIPSGKFEYYRDGGRWSVGYQVKTVKVFFFFKKKKIFSVLPSVPHCHNIELVETTKEDWKKDNGGYAPNI